MKGDIYRNFNDYFHFLAEDAVKYDEVGRFELIVTLRDGSVYSYYDPDKTIRKLPSDRNDLSENECRREFGIRLRYMMSRKGFNQRDLSEATGISYNNISLYINGKVSPSFYNVDKISKALGCSMDDLRYC